MADRAPEHFSMIDNVLYKLKNAFEIIKKDGYFIVRKRGTELELIRID